MQSRRGANGAVSECDELGVFRDSDISGIARIVEVILGLDERRTREFEVSRELFGPEATEALSNGPRRAARRAANLVAEFEVLRGRRLGNECIHTPLQVVGELPAIEILIASCDHAKGVGKNRAEPRTQNPEPGTRNEP